jgi:hypothetical protein
MAAQSVPGHGRPDPGLDPVMSERRQLINLAYRHLSARTIATVLWRFRVDLVLCLVDAVKGESREGQGKACRGAGAARLR